MLRTRLHRSLRILIHVAAVVLVLTVVAHAQQEADEPVAGDPQKSGESKLRLDEELFKKLFAQKRKNHEEAIHTLLKVDKYERQYKMVNVLTEAIVGIIESGRNVIENAGFVPGESSFPQNATVRDALSGILENTALFGDIILYLPDITHRVLKTRRWYTTIHWSLGFANRTRHLLNKSTVAMMRLVEQELNITERDPSYFNPYRSVLHASGREYTGAKKGSGRREKRKKSPQIAKIEL